jgi:hypothetical protein
VSKIDNRIKATAATTELRIASIEKTFSLLRISGGSLNQGGENRQHRATVSAGPKSIPSPVSQPSFHYEGEDESESRNTTAGDKERFEYVCPDVGYIRDTSIHGGIPWSPLGKPSNEHCEQRAHPHESRKDGNPYIIPMRMEG